MSSIAFAASCPPNLEKKKPIDQIVSRSIDVDGDGIEDKIELHVKGKDFFAPFRWELKIYSKETIIYQRSGNNERIEPFFSDPNYIGGCTGYDDCKCQWFFEKFLGRMIVRMSRGNVGVFDKTAPNSIYVIAKQHLSEDRQEDKQHHMPHTSMGLYAKG